MAETIPVAFVHGYTAEIHRLSAQRPTKFRSKVRVRTGITGKTHAFERLGASDLETIVSRHAATPILNPAHTRRRCSFTDKGGAILIDPLDELKMLIQPQNEYAMNHADSVNRFYDDLVIAAASGNSVSVGDDDTTSNITLASFDSGAHDIATDGAGLTFDKVNTVIRQFNEQDIAQEDRHAAISPAALEDLLAVTQVTSSDFSTLRAIQTGTMPAGAKWMGMEWTLTTRLSDTGSVVTLLFWHRSAIGLAIAKDITVRIDERPDLTYARQVYAETSAGAVRIEEAGVVALDITY